jgi:putative glutamine amidotransferase
MQLFNVVHGGTLIQHLELAERHQQRPPDAAADIHPVHIAPGTRLGGIFGAGEFSVNSRHHQGIGQVGHWLTVSALSDDGLVEGLERPDRHFAVAVQWHPEDRIAKRDRRLFEAFAEAMRP